WVEQGRKARSRAREFTEVAHRRKVRLLTSLRHESRIIAEHKTINLPRSLCDLLNLNGNTCRTFGECGRCAIPRESPLPVHFDFIVRIDDVGYAEFASENISALLADANGEAF